MKRLQWGVEGLLGKVFAILLPRFVVSVLVPMLASTSARVVFKSGMHDLKTTKRSDVRRSLAFAAWWMLTSSAQETRKRGSG